MFYARLVELCKEAGTSVAAVAEDVLHVSSGAPTFWKRGASPKAATVAIAARHFGVSADFLLGLTAEKRPLEGAPSRSDAHPLNSAPPLNGAHPLGDPLLPEAHPLSGAPPLDEAESRLVGALRAAPDPIRRAVLAMAASALEAGDPGEVVRPPRAVPGAPAQPAAPEQPARSAIRPFPPARSQPKKPARALKGVAGRAAAGPPITAVPEDDRHILVPVKYTGEQYFIVQAEGDSMRGVVEDGDYCVFNKHGAFDNGRIALVQVDGPTDQPDATIKRVYRRPGDKVELRSENPKYLPMLYPAEEVVLMGELTAVLPRDEAT